MAVTIAPGLRGFQIAVKLIEPELIEAVPTVRMMSSSVIASGKLVTVSAAKAAGEAIQDLWTTMFVPVVVVIRPVVLVVVPNARVPLPVRVRAHWG